MSRTINREIHTGYATGQLFGTKHGGPRNAALNWVHVEVTTSATAGNRTLLFSLCRVSDDASIYDIAAGVNQGASTTRHYNFVRGAVRENTFSGGNEILLPLADIVVGPGLYWKVTDINNIDAAGDTYKVGHQSDL